MQILKSFIIKIRVKHIIVLLVLGLLGVPLLNLIYGGIMNYSGYCFAENRYLTADEKIRITFNHINSKPKTTIRIGEGSNSVVKSFERIPYSSFEEYVKQNPDCCSVGKKVFSDLPPPDFFDRISGYNSEKIVVLNYKSNYFDTEINSLNAVEFTFYYVLTNCGNIKISTGYYTNDIQK
jgi:hypothetical protein